MATTFPPLLSPIIVIAIITLIFLARIQSTSKKQLKTKQYTHRHVHARYEQQFSPQMELDMRLPYRRFKQLYPHNNITYEEYKKNTNAFNIQTLHKLTTKLPNGTIKTKPTFPYDNLPFKH